MRQLHLVFNREAALGEALRWAAEGDALMLLGDATYALLDAQFATHLQSMAMPAMALASDLRCRVLSTNTAVVQVLDDDAWVALCAQYPTKSWY